MRIQTANHRIVRIALALAALGVAAGCSADFSSEPTPLITVIQADALIEEPTPHESCPIHPTEESSDDGCCGCHLWAAPGVCSTECQPQTSPCVDVHGHAIACESVPGGVIFHGDTYYRVGSGVDPAMGEYEYAKNQSGEDGVIKKNGGDNKVGVSFWNSQAAAEAARTRLGSTAKIHKVSSFAQADITFVSSMPPANHFHAVPNRTDMTLAQFRTALRAMKLTKVE